MQSYGQQMKETMKNKNANLTTLLEKKEEEKFDYKNLQMDRRNERKKKSSTFGS
jgi:hypothetical protein